MQPDQTPQNPTSGKGVAKQPHLLTRGKSAVSRFSAAYWLPRIYRPTYRRGTEIAEVAEWYARIQHGGRREAVGLGTNTREEAARRAVVLYQAIRSGGWAEALKKFKPEASASPRDIRTVGDYLAVVEPIAGVRGRTWDGYAYAFRKIAIESTGTADRTRRRFDPKGTPWRREADKVFLDRITPLAVEEWKKAFLDAAGSNPVKRLRAMRSANSFIRCARALFSRRILRKLGELGVPIPPLPFQGVDLFERTGSTRYQSEIDPATLLAEARAELADTDPDAWKVILLGLGAGLRRGEIDRLCRNQIDFAGGRIRVQTTEFGEVKTEDSEAEVFVDPGLIAELKRLVPASDVFAVEPGTPHNPDRAGQYYRCDETFARVTRWLRGHGVTASKPLHALRKEFGSILTEQAGIHAASRQLRHSQIGTTAAYYTDNRRRSTVDVGGMLKGKA